MEKPGIWPTSLSSWAGFVYCKHSWGLVLAWVVQIYLEAIRARWYSHVHCRMCLIEKRALYMCIIYKCTFLWVLWCAALCGRACVRACVCLSEWCLCRGAEAQSEGVSWAWTQPQTPCSFPLSGSRGREGTHVRCLLLSEWQNFSWQCSHHNNLETTLYLRAMCRSPLVWCCSTRICHKSTFYPLFHPVLAILHDTIFISLLFSFI